MCDLWDQLHFPTGCSIEPSLVGFKQESGAQWEDSNRKDSAWVQAIESAMEVLELISPYY